MTISTTDRHRRRAMLLEFLKFRVLAAEDHFFSPQHNDQRRAWLKQLYPQALVLSDQDLDEVWQQAHNLYGCH
ncbi:MAG: hypothetical protein ACON4T_09295 [Synechococcus sp.]